MSDRLKQIWTGFERRTARHLTGNGIDNINVPSRREWRAEDVKFLPDDFEAPADRAFAALRYKLAEANAKHRGRSRRNALGDGLREDSAYGPSLRSREPHVGAGDPRQAMLASMRETDFRVLRREINYIDFAARGGATEFSVPADKRGRRTNRGPGSNGGGGGLFGLFGGKRRRQDGSTRGSGR